jgi:para-nitrobenzyl esterase
MNTPLRFSRLPDTVQVSIASGRLAGQQESAIYVFRGIPYAAPPVGHLRWRPPQPVKSWEGVRPALSVGPAPMQVLPSASSLMYRLNHDDRQPLVMSEDCLYLNVWSPDLSPTTRLPVLVWIHGGGNATGHGGQALFNGHNLAARGIVVVTLNMRLGALGFLSHPALAQEDDLGASGNYGLQDIAAALRWVQENIAVFGGDPSKVTLGGNSAGAASITHLMIAPVCRGLFRAAIAQSASGIFRPDGPMQSHDAAAKRGAERVATLGKTLTALRELPATAFLTLPPQPVSVDGRLLIEDTQRCFLDGRQAVIPLLAGWNADEGSLYSLSGQMNHQGLDDWARLEDCYRTLYDDHPADFRRALTGDTRFIYPVWRWATTHAHTSNAPVWLYEFNHRLPIPDDVPPPSDGGQDYGAFHTAELPYIWDNLAARPWAWREDDRLLAKRLADGWTRFVSHCDPRGVGLQTWAPISESVNFAAGVFGINAQPGIAARQAAFGLLDYLHSVNN